MKAILAGLLLIAFVLPLQATIHELPLLVNFHDLSKESQKQVSCLAENIFFEAASESTAGKVAVAFVTINRVLSGRFPNTLCGVVQQKIQGVCQFSWYCDPTKLHRRQAIKHTPLYNDILRLSIEVLIYHKVFEDMTKGATYFHNTSTNPRWRLQRTAQIGNHVFYRHGKDRHEISTSRQLFIH
jgi:spore germination cell wall hydrolase CwlJ-like protein